MNRVNRVTPWTYHNRILSQLSSGVSAKLISPVTVRYKLKQAFNHTSFNAFGNVHPWSIPAIADSAFCFHYYPMINNHGFLDFDKLTSFMIFFAAADLSFGDELYDHSLDKSEIDIQYTLCHVGKTSISLRYDLYSPHTDICLATGRLKSVLVNTETRKPCPFPEWWKEKFSRFVPEDAIPFVVTSVPKQSGSELSSLTSTVLSSLIDTNLHAGWYFHVKLYIDAYINWHYRRFGFLGNGEAFRNVKYLKLLLKNEASLGEEIKLDFHSVIENKNTFQFYLENKKGAVSECLIEFYPIPGQQEHTSKI